VSYLIGLDVGSTNLKVILYDIDRRAESVFSCATRTHYPRPDWAEYNAGEIWADLAGLLRQAAQTVPDPSAIQGIAVASMGEAGLLVDRQGRPLTPIIAWFDGRTKAQSRWWEETVGLEEVYAITGHPIHPSFGINKLMWLREHAPDAFADAAYWFSVEDFILYRLCGVAATDYSAASRTMAFDIRAHQWSGSLLDRARIPVRLMPPAFLGGTAIGQVTRQAAEETGLDEGVRVVTGGHDQMCASLAVGAFEPGHLLDSTGTSESLVLTVAEALPSAEVMRQSLAQECHVVRDRYAILAHFPVAGYAVEWLNRLLEHGKTMPDYGLAEAARVAPGAEGLFFLPHLRGSGSPSFDPLCRGALVGLTPAHGRGHLLRAAVEGVCYEIKANILMLEAAASCGVQKTYAAGRVTESDLWLHIKANVTGRQLNVARLAEMAGLGAALLAGLGVGLFATPDEAAGSLQADWTVVEPQPEQAAFYEAQYSAVYSKIYPALRDLFRVRRA
jgi:xylulokinase